MQRGVFLISLTCVSAFANEYQIAPASSSGSKVTFTAPKGWHVWRPNPGNGKAHTAGDRALLREAQTHEALLVETGCEDRNCPHLSVETFDLEAWQPLDPAKQALNFVEAIRKDRQGRGDTDPYFSRYDSFDAGKNGNLSIWQIRCSFYNDYFLVAIIQKHTLVYLYLSAPDVNRIVGKLDSLKEIARSLRFVNR